MVKPGNVRQCPKHGLCERGLQQRDLGKGWAHHGSVLGSMLIIVLKAFSREL